MLTRKIISTLMAVVFVAAMAFTPAFADDTPPSGGTGTGNQHPWDINDGSVTNGGTINQAPSAAYVVFPGWFGNVISTALMVAWVAPTAATAVRVDTPVRSGNSIKRPVQTRNLSR